MWLGTSNQSALFQSVYDIGSRITYVGLNKIDIFSLQKQHVPYLAYPIRGPYYSLMLKFVYDIGSRIT